MRVIKIFMISGTAVMLAACSNDEMITRVPTEGARPIEYSVAAANVTRAANSYCNQSMPQSLTLWAYGVNGSAALKNKHYIDGDILENDGNGKYFDTKGVRYWPTKQKDGDPDAVLDFIAYTDGMADEDGTNVGLVYEENTAYDAGAETVQTKKQYTYKGYEVDGNFSKQGDLMYAVTPAMTEKDEKGNARNVTLNFRHALSQICFKAENMNEHVAIYIKDITVGELKCKGDYKFPTVNTVSNYVMHDDIIDSDPFENNRGEWKNIAADTKDFSLKFTDETNKKGILCSEINNLPHDQANPYKYALNLIPQTNEKWPITLTIAVANISNDKYPNGKPKDTYEFTGDITVPLTTSINWKQGNRYTYKFRFERDWTPENVNAITIDVTVDDFVNNVVEYNYVGETTKAILMRKETGTKGAADYLSALYVAQCNLGANYPYEAGLYFYYTDVEGHKLASDGIFYDTNGEKFSYGMMNDNLRVFAGHGAENLGNDGWITKTGKTVYGKDEYELTAKGDAAQVLTDGRYRTPSAEDMEWLFNENNTIITNEKMNGIDMYRVESRETGGVVFFPRTGWACEAYNTSGGYHPGYQLNPSDGHFGDNSNYRVRECYKDFYQGGPSGDYYKEFPPTDYTNYPCVSAATMQLGIGVSDYFGKGGEPKTQYVKYYFCYTVGGCPIRPVAYENPDYESPKTTPENTEGGEASQE